jgi:protein-L-isoaspartate O-methyltransferase
MTWRKSLREVLVIPGASMASPPNLLGQRLVKKGRMIAPVNLPRQTNVEKIIPAAGSECCVSVLTLLPDCSKS